MSWENIIVLVLVLAFWAFSAVAQRLKEEMGKASTEDKTAELHEWIPMPEMAPEEKPEFEKRMISAVPAEWKDATGFSRDDVGISKKESIVQRLGLESPHSLRRGIILMAVLGPCRALEPSDECNRR